MDILCFTFHDMMINEWWTRKDLQGNGVVLIEGAISAFAWRTEEDQVRTQSREPVPGPRF